jgi:cytochrome c2
MVMMKMIRTPLAPALILLVLVANSAVAADAASGERLAERWCAACHVVTTAQRQANADAPPFEEIAKRPAFTDYVPIGPTR